MVLSIEPRHDGVHFKKWIEKPVARWLYNIQAKKRDEEKKYTSVFKKTDYDKTKVSYRAWGSR